MSTQVVVARLKFGSVVRKIVRLSLPCAARRGPTVSEALAATDTIAIDGEQAAA